MTKQTDIMLISLNDINYVTESVADPVGRVFFYNDRLYRIINKNEEDNVLNLLNSELWHKLSNLGYVPETKIADDIQMEDGSLVLEHERLVDTKPNEWCFSMYKDAAAFILKLNRLCNESGYELKDGHPNNILFRNGYPVFVDFGSFRKCETIPVQWRAYLEFIYTFYLPLLMWQKGDYFMLRMITESGFNPRRVMPAMEPFMSPTIINYFKPLYRYKISKRCFCISTRSNFIKCSFAAINKLMGTIFHKNGFFHITRTLKQLTEDDINIMHSHNTATMWANYQNEMLEGSHQLSPRFERILQLADTYCGDAKSVIDLAGNSAVFSKMLYDTRKYSKIINVDYDENALNTAHNFIKENNLNIDLVLTNFVIPRDLNSITKRLQSDIVFALAVTHHLILTQHIPIASIFERINMYVKKYVFIEFMPWGLWSKESDTVNVPLWYTQDWFANNFSQFFNILHVEKLADNRIIFIGEKKS